ncbi:hypothetical protein EJ04DRAFT_516310 [Polyplosphaeria fusca]|uniref:EthD domain-containing protein n=1 Tax=Polyplosphaeria fusca TaxID=682080 RepID=A0A9P4QQ88_9PLEO|nr:hypothetical protein EJ04DRAFT_516310 [Polyplosphaeria fusca]
MTFQQYVVYPRKEGATFNEEYYKTKHMPRVEELWAPHGLKSWKVVKFHDDNPYTYAGVVEWESVDAFQKAMQQDSVKEIMGDLVNFSNEQPQVLMGDVLTASS